MAVMNAQDIAPVACCAMVASALIFVSFVVCGVGAHGRNGCQGILKKKNKEKEG
jgi:hypothetical protein